jgi:hypothetical protein
MEIAGSRREVDLSRMGPMLVIASSLILAIRTARWPRASVESASDGQSNVPSNEQSDAQWEAEVEQAVRMAHRIFAHLVNKSPFLFQYKDAP